MNTPTTFFRLLHVPIDAKGDALAEHIAAFNVAGAAEETYTLDPAAFAQIPGSPFAYWASPGFLRMFQSTRKFETENRTARVGLSTSSDFRFLRAWWEVAPNSISVSREETLSDQRWVAFSKGGIFSPYYSDLHLVLDWHRNGEALRDFIRSKGDSPSRSIRSESLYFLSGLTWPLRASKFAPYILPQGCIFGVRGYAIIASAEELPVLLGILNSTPFDSLFKLSLGRYGFPEFVVGVLQELPWIDPSPDVSKRIAELATEAYTEKRNQNTDDEISRFFCLPRLAVHKNAGTLREASAALDAKEEAREARQAAIQAQIDDIVFDLYGLSEADRALVRRETGSPQLEAEEEGVEDEEEAGEETAAPQDPITRVQDLLMWCVGVAFGRWDIRKALDPSLLPPLGEPFDPLPRYAPGALTEENRLRIVDAGLAPSSIFNLQSSIPQDGILVDDPTHPSDIVRRVREVLELLWGERVEAVETEACEILGVKSLREYFRDPRRFFAYHIKRYSKSRRKAPIYWLLQSERRGYGIWLYYHRITPMTPYIAGRDYADAKIALERGRLDDLRAGLEALTSTARRKGEREIERQEKLVFEVTAFGKTLDKIALANLPPDPNDGVLINIAPLHPLVPWSEAARMWDALRSGQYGWSTMAKQLKTADR